MKSNKLQYIGGGILAVLILIQFIAPAHNLSNDNTNDISKKYPVSAEVQHILKTSCNDCHSNLTVYPWYSKIQPVAWWLQHHVNEGKEKLNYSEFLAYAPYRQFHKMEETIEMLDEHEMPLSSYIWMHDDAKLSTAQENLLKEWAQSVMDSLRANYPPDSLINPKKRK
jgi:hypothetical protein